MKTTWKHTPTSLAVGTALVLSLHAAFGQSPFVEVMNTGNLGHDPANAGASWGDYDGDGDVDLYVTSANPDYPPNHVYRNDGDGIFTRMGESNIGDLALDDGDASMGVWADIDNDGDLDLFVANQNFNSGASSGAPDLVYLNNGNGTFEKREPPAFSQPLLYSNCASLFDYDNDGLLDVFVTTWPQSGAGVDVLYHNDDNVQFSSASSVWTSTEGLVGFWGDVDQDGDYDVIVGDFSTSRPSPIYLNQATQMQPGTFVRQTTLPADGRGTPLPARLSDADWGDFDNDGDLDLLAGHSSHSGCDVFRNDAGSYTKLIIPLRSDLRSGTVVWVDVDNDALLDMLVETWDTNLGDIGRAYSYLRNEGAESFAEEVVVSGLPFLGNLFVPVIGDMDNDGAMDFFSVVAGNTAETARDRLWRNLGNENHWLKLVLKGTESNASAVGAIARVKAVVGGAETWQMRQVFVGGKYQAQLDPRPNFGLGDATVASIVRIEWPSGTVQQLLNVAADQILTVVEPPRLRVELGNRLSWPVTADGYKLESATTISGQWSEIAETVQTEGSRKSVPLQPDAGTRFYRLNSL
jgi:hypothetical protein